MVAKKRDAMRFCVHGFLLIEMMFALLLCVTMFGFIMHQVGTNNRSNHDAKKRIRVLYAALDVLQDTPSGTTEKLKKMLANITYEKVPLPCVMVDSVATITLKEVAGFTLQKVKVCWNNSFDRQEKIYLFSSSAKEG